MLYCRDCIGDSVLTGDLRWAGTFGVNLDFVARSHCSVEFISAEDMQVNLICAYFWCSVFLLEIGNGEGWVSAASA